MIDNFYRNVLRDYDITVTLYWLAGHVNLSRIEIADKAVNAAAVEATLDTSPNITGASPGFSAFKFFFIIYFEIDA